MSLKIENNFAFGAYSNETIILEDAWGGQSEWELSNGTILKITLSSNNRKDFVISIPYQEDEGTDLYLPSYFKSLFLLKEDTFSYGKNSAIVYIKVEADKKEIATGTIFVLPAVESLTEDMIKNNSRLGESKSVTFFKDYPQKDLYIEKSEGDMPFAIKEKTRGSDTREVVRIVDECGIFLRWRNTYGGWSYWLFSQDYTEDVKTKSLGSTLIKDSYVGGGEDIFYPFGMTSKKTWTLTSEVPVLDYEIEEVKSLFVSPEVYIWKGKEVSDIYPKHWERVNVVEGTQKFKHNSQYTHPLSVTIEFQEPKTITQL